MYVSNGHAVYRPNEVPKGTGLSPRAKSGQRSTSGSAGWEVATVVVAVLQILFLVTRFGIDISLMSSGGQRRVIVLAGYTSLDTTQPMAKMDPLGWNYEAPEPLVTLSYTLTDSREVVTPTPEADAKSRGTVFRSRTRSGKRGRRSSWYDDLFDDKDVPSTGFDADKLDKYAQTLQTQIDAIANAAEYRGQDLQVTLIILTGLLAFLTVLLIMGAVESKPTIAFLWLLGTVGDVALFTVSCLLVYQAAYHLFFNLISIVAILVVVGWLKNSGRNREKVLREPMAGFVIRPPGNPC